MRKAILLLVLLALGLVPLTGAAHIGSAETPLCPAVTCEPIEVLGAHCHVGGPADQAEVYVDVPMVGPVGVHFDLTNGSHPIGPGHSPEFTEACKDDPA
jgi:hypothetical protein